MIFSKVKAGLIGCGMMGNLYTKTITNYFNNMVEITACCSLRGESAKTFSALYGVRACQLDEILEDHEIELVIVLTPVPSHAEITRKAIEAGKHVYTEKTIAETYEQAISLVELAKTKGVMLCSAPDTLLGRGLQTAKRLLQEHCLGDITGFQLMINRNYGRLYESLRFLLEPGAGALMDIGPYFLSALVYLLGDMQLVAGMSRISRPERLINGSRQILQNENCTAAIIKLHSGIMGTLYINADSDGLELPYFVIHGTKGSLLVHEPNRFDGAVMLSRNAGNWEEIPLLPGVAGIIRGIGVAEMADALRKNRQPFLQAASALHIIEAMEAIYESGKHGYTVALRSQSLYGACEFSAVDRG